jgi:predicted ATPase
MTVWGPERTMIKDQDLAALIEQAARNLKTLQLLISTHSTAAIDELQQRVQALRDAYTRETDALTRQVLRRAIDRRRGIDRRKQDQSTRSVS